MRLKLGPSIVLAVAAGLLIPLTIVNLMVEAHREVELTKRLESDHQRLTDILAIGMKESLWTFNAEAARPVLDSVTRDPRVLEAVVRDARLGEFMHERFPERRTGSEITLERDVVNGERTIGSVTLVMDTGAVEAEIGRERTVFALMTLAQFALSILLVVLLLQVRFIEPIQRLMRQSQRLTRRDLDIPFVWERDDEIGSLGKSLERTREAWKALFEELMAEQHELEERTAAVLEREGRIRRLVEANVIGIAFWRMTGEVTDANDEFLRIAGLDRGDLARGRVLWSDLTPPEWHAADEKAREQLRETGTCRPYEKEYVRKDGSRVSVLVGRALFEGSQEQGVAFIVDLSAQKQAEERVRYMAYHDELTGLPNRALIDDRLAQAIAHARRSERSVATLALGLDHFKYVNDSLSQPVGDRILRAAGRRLRRCVRDDDSVGRLGGDRFVVVLPNVESGQAAALVASKILETFGRPFILGGRNLRITASVGISVFPTDGVTSEALVRAAEGAMYAAKERGRNNFQYFAGRLNEASRHRVEITSALQSALKRQEFVLHYQPQVVLASGAISSAEALLRWRRGGELVSCGDFISIAEESGLIVPIGEWVLQEACRQLKLWHDAGHSHLHVAVNVSPRQLREGGFPHAVAEALGRSGVAPAGLELEITESLLMQQTPDNIATLANLVDLGVRLSIDDFGVGYSNLGYLQRFPIHSLKIDRSFVNGVMANTNDRAIVLAITAMAKSLGVKVVAEGVETSAQASFLQSHDCDAVQGYLYGRPVPPAEFLTMLTATESVAEH